MADVGSMFEDNTTGTFYVDEEFIDCDLCREIAPTIFHRNDDGGYSFVAKQPEVEEEHLGVLLLLRAVLLQMNTPRHHFCEKL